jgi:hypothetical protein
MLSGEYVKAGDMYARLEEFSEFHLNGAEVSRQPQDLYRSKYL